MHSTGLFRTDKIVVFSWAVAIAAMGSTQPADASLIAQYEMNSPTQLVNSAAAATFYQPNLVDPGSPGTPTYLAGGGVNGSGAFQFDGVSNYLTFGNAGYLYLADSYSNWTVSFWIKTTDGGVNSGGYAGTPEVPVLGNTTGGVGFGLGIDGGKAAYRRYSGGWFSAGGATNVADGLGHYVTFVAVGSSNLNIYVDGQVDALNLSVPAAGSGQLAIDLGRSYGSPNPKYGAFTLDDLRVYNTALSLGEIRTELGVPEPSVVTLLGLGGLTLLWRRRSS